MPALRRWSMPHWVAGNAPGCAFTGEMLFEDGAIIVLFLVLRGMYWEAFGGMCHLFVADGSGSDGFQRINPTVAHTVGELFFLPPGNALREHVGKGFADYFFSISLPGHILTAGLMRMATSRNSLSRKGTRPSTPQAARLLLARSSRTDVVWRACARFLRERLAGWAPCGSKDNRRTPRLHLRR